MHITITPPAAEVLIDAAEYSRTVIHKCFYWYTRDFNVEITSASSAQWRIMLTAKELEAKQPWEQLPARINNDLLDFSLREIVAEETRTIRELLVAKAFANYDTQAVLESDISDPVGFHPEHRILP
jgi:His-Xaa-Ser system protein HxsD